MIRGEINASESLSQVSPEAELVFRALLLAVDDYGRADARPAALKATLFPMRDAFTAKKIAAWVDELAALSDPPVRIFELDRRRYLWLPKWEKHRAGGRRALESRFPAPPSDSQEILGDPRKPQEILPRDEGRGTSSEGRGTSPRTARAAATEVPEVLTVEQQQALYEWSVKAEPWATVRLPTLSAACLDHHRARGNKARIVDWVAACRTWVTNERKYHGTGGTNGPQRPGSSNGRRLTAVEAGRKIIADFERRAGGAQPIDVETVHNVPALGDSGH